MNSTILDFVPIVLMFFVAIGFVTATMFVTHLLGPNRKTKIKQESFECGIEPQGDARTPFSVKYFLIAILFVLFDVEVIFFYPWAVNFKSFIATQGFAGFGKMLLFMMPVLIGFFYVYKKGALDWE